MYKEKRQLLSKNIKAVNAINKEYYENGGFNEHRAELFVDLTDGESWYEEFTSSKSYIDYDSNVISMNAYLRFHSDRYFAPCDKLLVKECVPVIEQLMREYDKEQ